VKKKVFILKPVEKFLINQFTPLHTVRGFKWFNRLFSGVPALKERDARRFFFGQFVSNIGSWMQLVALGWLAYEISHSAFWVGVVTASGSISTLILSLFGGSIVDMFPKKKVLLATHITAATLATIIGILSLTNHININLLIIFSFLGGVINSIYTPAHYAFISELVDKENISSAVSINASVSSLGRILGPALAGLYIRYAGISGAFFINTISYLAVIFALVMIKRPSIVTNNHLKPLEAIKEGLAYCFKNPMIRATLLYTSISSIFALSYTTIIPVIAKEIFRTDVVGMSSLHTAIGLGAITATIVSTLLTQRTSKFILFFSGNALFAISLFCLTLTSSLSFGAVLSFFAGLGITLVTIMLSIIAMNSADSTFRGRVSSTYYMTIGGIAFLGNLEIGYLSQKFGSATTLQINAIVMFFVGLIVLSQIHKLRKNQTEYNQNT